MTETNETRDEKTFGISRGLLLRLVPITLFVALGTFAVVQSILGEKNAKTNQEVAAASDDSTAPQPLLENAPNGPNKTGTDQAATPNPDNSKSQPADKSASFPTGNQANFDRPALANLGTPPSNQGSPDNSAFHSNPTNPNQKQAKPPTTSAEDLLNQAVNEKTPGKPAPGSFQSIAVEKSNTQQGTSQPPAVRSPDFIQNQASTNSSGGNANPLNSNIQSENREPIANKPAALSFSDKPAASPFALNKPIDSNPNQNGPPDKVNPNSLSFNEAPLDPSKSGNSLRSGEGQIVGANPSGANPNSGIPPLVSQPSPFANPSNQNAKLPPTQGNLADPPAANGNSDRDLSKSGNPSSNLAATGNRLGDNFSSSNSTPLVQPRHENTSGGNPPLPSYDRVAGANASNPSNLASSNYVPTNVAVPRTDRSTLSAPGSSGGEDLQANRDRIMNPGAADSRVLANSKPGGTELEGVQTPSLSIEKVAPREIQLDQPTDFKIVVRNVGRVVANEVRVIDQVPAGALFVRASAEPDRLEGTQLTWNLGTLKPNDERVIVVTLQPKMVGEIGSVAQVTFATPASVKTTVTKPQLSIEHSGPEKVMIGDRVALEINVTNSGNGPAREVVIQENVPPQLKFAEDFDELEYEIGTLAPGQSRKVTLTLAAAQIGRFRNSVLVAGAGGLQAQHHIDMEVVAPKLALSCDGPNRRYLKRNASHTFAVRNVGTAIATNLDLIAKLPRGVRYVSANNQGQYDPGSHAVYWSLDKINTGEVVQVALTTTPIEAGDHDIEFIATADLNQRESLKQPLAIEHLVDLFFEIDDIEDVIEIGSETRYRIRLMNQGTTPATNVQLTLGCEPGIRPVATDKNLPGEVRGQEVIFAPIQTIRPGEEFVAIVTATATAAGEHRVVANLKSDQREDMNVSKEESTRVYADR